MFGCCDPSDETLYKIVPWARLKKEVNTLSICYRKNPKTTCIKKNTILELEVILIFSHTKSSNHGDEFK